MAMDAWPDHAGAEHVEDATCCVGASDVAVDAADVGGKPVLHSVWGCLGQGRHYLADHHDRWIHCSSGANIAAIGGHCC